MLLLLLCASVTLTLGGEHEIVYPRMIVGRSGEKKILFRAFDQDFHLRLERTNVLSEDFVLITKDEKGYEVFVKPDIEYWRNRVLQDRAVGSTIDVDDEGGSLKIKGVINEQLRIEPALDHVANNHEDNIEGRRGFVKEVPHKIFKVKPRKSRGGRIDSIVPPGEKLIDTNVTDEEERQNPVVVVEPAFTLDVVLSERLGTDYNCIRYVIILINSVCLRFETMKNLRVNITVVGVKRNKSSLDEPYIANNMYKGCVLSERVVYDFGQYCLQTKLFSGADLNHLLCGADLGDQNGDVADTAVAGIAYMGTVCDRSGYNVGVSEDNGRDFDGCSTVAHELCHNLGCPHDGEESPSYIKGSPGAVACPWDDGYIMSYITRDEKQYCFSKCSEQCVAYMLKITTCLVTPNMKSTISATDNRLPGQFFSDLYKAKDQTSYYNRRCNDSKAGAFAKEFPQGGCTYQCRTPTVKYSYTFWNVPCLDGEPCSATGDKVCKNGICT